MGLFSNIAGTLSSFFQIGGTGGPGFNNSSGVIQARNSANNAFARLQVAGATNDNDAVNLITLATWSSEPIPCSVQWNGGTTLPSNSSTQQWYVVTTSGAYATIGQILYDDGSNTGTVTAFSAQTYGSIFTPNALTGGTVTFAAGSEYYWTGTGWSLKSSTYAGGDQTMSITIGTSSSYTSTNSIPANAIIKEAYAKITTAYSSGGTLSVGISGSTSLFVSTTDFTTTVIDEYQKTQRTSVGSSAAQAVATIGGSPSTGAGTVYLTYVVPLT